MNREFPGVNPSSNQRMSAAMKREIDEDRLVHYFAGECTEQEAEEIEAWMREDPARRARVQQLRRIWEAADQPATSDRDVDAAWDRLVEMMGASGSRRRAPHSREGAPPTERKPRRRRRRPRWVYAAVAAATVALVAVALFLVSEEQTGSDELAAPALRKVETEASQRANVQLSDGTHIILNAKSTLSFPDEFADDVREVHLQGEAFFDVASEMNRPFVVRTETAVTQVLGTSFNVGAYPEDDATQVVVTEGKVAVRPKQSQSGEAEEATLTAGHLARLSKTRKMVLRKNVDIDRYLAWTKGRLVFKDAPFEEVAQKLEHWYDLRVRLADASMEVDRLNATFQDEPVSEVLSVIAKTLSLRYEREGKTVTFFAARSSF